MNEDVTEIIPAAAKEDLATVVAFVNLANRLMLDGRFTKGQEQIIVDAIHLVNEKTTLRPKG